MPLVDASWTGSPTASHIEYGGSHGSFYITAGAATTIAAGSTDYKQTSTTTVAGASLVGFSHTSPNRLTYLSPDTKMFLAKASVVVTAAGDAKTIGIRIAKDGVSVASSEVDLAMATGAVATVFNSQCLVELDHDEYLEIWISNETDGTNATVASGHLVVTEVE